jgi:DNA-binding GntR family transcriptional regulator
MIEPYVLETYGHLLALSDIQDMYRKIHASGCETDNLYEYDLDHNLHEMLVRACDNPYIIELMAKVFVQNHRLRILSGQNLEYRLRETAMEHEQILYWLDQRQPHKAAEAMRVHLKHAKEAAINMMANSKGWKQIV